MAGAAVAAFAVLTSAPLAANATVSAAAEPTAQTVASTVDGVALRVAPTAATTIAPEAPVTLEVEVVNATTEPIPAGTLRLVRSDDTIDDPAEIDTWLTQASGPDGADAIDGTIVAEIDSATLAPGAVDVVSVTLPPETVDDIDDSPVLGFGAELLVDGALVATSAEVFANSALPVASPTALAITYPLTVPASSTGRLSADDLATWTSPFGLLSRQLDAVAGRSVTVAIDPRIIASIRALGSSAPATAVAWLERLAGIPNEIFPLAYADADVAAQAQLGIPALLAPTGFSDVLDAANFAAPTEGDDTATEGDDAGGDGGATASPTPTPTAPAPDALPTTEELLAWPYTRTDIAWPADDTIATGDLAYLGAAGLTTSILSPGNVAPGSQWANAASTVDGASAVVADSRLTAPLREATSALSDTEWRAAVGQLSAELALIDAADVRPTALLATIARGTGTQSERLEATLDELAANPWATSASFTDVVGAPPVSRTLIDEPETQQRIANVERIIRTGENITAFATVLEDPTILSDPTRRDALALLDVAWIADRTAWDAAVGEWLVAQRRTLGAVSVVPSSPINVVSSETGVPTTILNALPYPVTVVVDVAPSNGRLIVEDQATVTIAPESRTTTTVPVAAGIGSGSVTLTVSLTSVDGVPIGSPVSIPANVQADWEGLGAAIIGIIVVVFFGVGVWRNIRRLRRKRAEAAANGEAVEPAAAAEVESGAETDAATSTGPDVVDADPAIEEQSAETDEPRAERRDD
ncbi:hypothetical protein ASE14_11800 [Agromyces sp. Root81]|nr:hypothetical protein ASE14_11800 [Agromyces sp. Root81]